MKMEQSQLSEHEKFIVMIDKSRTGLTGSMRCFMGFKDVLSALQEMSKSDSDTMTWNGTDVTKPVTRNEAQRLLINFDNLKWDNTFKRVANSLGIQLR